MQVPLEHGFSPDFNVPAYCFDVETFPNFWMFGVQHYRSGEVLQWSSEPGIGGTLDEARAWFKAHKDHALFIGFNSAAYDNIMCQAVLVQEQSDCDALFALSKATITADWVKQESIQDELSIDLLAIHGGKNSSLGSLKELGVKLDYPHLQELPYGFDAVLDHAQMQEVQRYHRHDLAITALAARSCEAAILMRLVLAAEYGLRSLLNRHEAGMAMDVVASRLFSGKPEWYRARVWNCRGERFARKFRFRTPELETLRQNIARWSMHWELRTEVDDSGDTKKSIVGEAFSDTVRVDDVGYRLGVGGLHSTDEAGIWEAGEQFRLMDFDVDSFYPALVINHKLHPSHLVQRQFIKTFTELRDRRLAAKQAKQTVLSAGLKVSINSVFGKTGSPYGWICDPVMLCGITLLGQLSLLSFVDALAGIEGVKVLSANTDGILVRVRRDLAEDLIAGVNAIATEMNFTLSWDEFTKLVRRDISSYIAVRPDGSIKARGSYRYDQKELGKKAVNRVVIDAVQAFFVHDTPLADTIRGCTNIAAFIDYFKATKQYHIVGSDGVDHGGIARWYRATTGVRLDKRRRSDGKLFQLVESGAKVVAELPAGMPSDVDYAAYEAMAERLVRMITEPDVRVSTTLPLTELSQAQAARQRFNLETTTADLERCANVDLQSAQRDYDGLFRGNAYDSMKALAVRLWVAERGALTRGDLLWLLQQLDSSTGKYHSPAGMRTLGKMVDWVARAISPFPIPQTTAEHVDRAITWATEHVEPLKRKRAMHHQSVHVSTYLTGDTLRKYAKNRDEFALACAIAAVGVKHSAMPDRDHFIAIISDIKNYFEAQHDPV